MEIRYKTGFRLKAKPEDTWNELMRVREIGGGDILPATLVKESRPKDAPLHGEFEWSNAKAANKYREEQARYIIRSLEVPSNDGKTATPAIAAVRKVEVDNAKPAKPRQVYRTVEDIMTDPDSRDELLARAIQDALTFKRKYAALQELAKVFAALDETLMELKA